MSRLASLLVAAFLLFPDAAFSLNTISGVADVMAALYVDERKPGCSGFHLKKDYIYITPTDTGASNSSAWQEIAAGPGLAEKYQISTGDKVRVRFKASNSTNTSSGVPSSSHRRLLSDPAATLSPPTSDGETMDMIDGIDVLVPSEPHEIFTGDKIRIKSMIYLISTCGWPAAATVEDVQNAYFYNNLSIKGYHDSCSYGKFTFDPADNFVVGPVEVPCTGTVDSGWLTFPYDSSVNCGAAEQYAWRLAGEAAARAAGYGDFMDNPDNNRRRVIHILPANVKCPWAGLASVGCGGASCSAYIKGNYATNLPINMHEISHTHGLSHAGKGLDEYGDTSDVMGTASGNGYLCMNPGNQMRVGWNYPIAALQPYTTNNAGNGGGGLGTGSIWVIPPESATDTNHVFLNYSINGVPFPNYLISFRTRTSTFDNILPSTLNNKVFIHNFNGTTSERDWNRSMLITTLGRSGVFTSPFVDMGNDKFSGGGVRIRVVSITAGVSATVQICRFTVLEESGGDMCADGIDNDCDGLIDADDPDCGLIPSPPLPPPDLPDLPPSPPPPSPPPPRPPPPRPPPP
ncbi:hypothetical protein Agub_g6672, partial [Astrephomene gubernaculifera]